MPLSPSDDETSPVENPPKEVSYLIVLFLGCYPDRPGKVRPQVCSGFCRSCSSFFFSAAIPFDLASSASSRFRFCRNCLSRSSLSEVICALPRAASIPRAPRLWEARAVQLTGAVSIDRHKAEASTEAASASCRFSSSIPEAPMSFHSLPSCGRQQPSAWVRVWKRSSVIGAPHAPTCCTARRRRPETLLNSSSSSGSRLIPDLRVRVSTMPFQPYASYFKPEELRHANGCLQ